MFVNLRQVEAYWVQGQGTSVCVVCVCGGALNAPGISLKSHSSSVFIIVLIYDIHNKKKFVRHGLQA